MQRTLLYDCHLELDAQLMHDVIADDKDVKQAVSQLRQQYLEMAFCFKADAFEDQMKAMMKWITFPAVAPTL